MTAICVIGTELSARLPARADLRRRSLALLAVRASSRSCKVAAGDAPAGAIDPSLSLVQPVRDRRVGALHARRADGRVHLLGLGERGQPQRGERGLRQRARAGRPVLDGHPARHLRRGDGRRGQRSPASTTVAELRGRHRRSSARSPTDVLGTELELARAAGDHHLGPRRRPRRRSCPPRARRSRWRARGRSRRSSDASIRAS